MSIWITILSILFLFFMICLRHRRLKPVVWYSWEPFKMTTIVERKDGSTFERDFIAFEYIGKETEGGTIIAIYLNQELSEKQKKWEAYCDEWR